VQSTSISNVPYHVVFLEGVYLDRTEASLKPRVHLVRYAGCLAPHSALREAIIPTPRQQGVEEQAASTASLPWSWARLLKRVFALEMARCPFCQRGALRIIATITQGEVISKILRHLKHAADPPPIAPARSRQETFDWVA
jgi:hypothetical protein